MAEAAIAPLEIRARDVTGQKRFRLKAVPGQASVGELVRTALARMGLGTRDHNGQELEYRARLQREGRQLHNSERVGDVLQHVERALAGRESEMPQPEDDDLSREASGSLNKGIEAFKGGDLDAAYREAGVSI